MIAKDAGHRLVYCAVDDLEANLRAMPFFIKPVKSDDPSGIKLISEGAVPRREREGHLSRYRY